MPNMQVFIHSGFSDCAHAEGLRQKSSSSLQIGIPHRTHHWLTISPHQKTGGSIAHEQPFHSQNRKNFGDAKR